MPNYLDPNLFIGELIKGQQEVTNRVMSKALQRSSGKYKAKKLKDLGHPYSTRNFGGWVPYMDPGIINVQSGAFYFHWKQVSPYHKGDFILSSVYNDDFKADVLAKGKDTTIPRPLIEGLLPVAEYWQRWWAIRSIKNAIIKS